MRSKFFLLSLVLSAPDTEPQAERLAAWSCFRRLARASQGPGTRGGGSSAGSGLIGSAFQLYATRDTFRLAMLSLSRHFRPVAYAQSDRSGR